MKKIFLILAIVIAFVLVICAFNYKWIYYRFYLFDRITGEFEISLNGKEINAVDEYYEYENGCKIRLKNFQLDTSKISKKIRLDEVNNTEILIGI